MITFKPLENSHLPLLLKWLETPHVKAWWDQDIHWTPALIQEKYGSYVEGYKIENGLRKPMHAYVICFNNIEIGYIQLYNAHDFPREDNTSLNELPASLAAFDIFIGEESYVGKGIGSMIMQQFLQEKVDPHYEACFVDPDTANTRAIKAYEKVGFKIIKMIDDGAVSWMLRERA
jgi:aminoglycoside 6'-N-acetyltransferase